MDSPSGPDNVTLVSSMSIRIISVNPISILLTVSVMSMISKGVSAIVASAVLADTEVILGTAKSNRNW